MIIISKFPECRGDCIAWDGREGHRGCTCRDGGGESQEGLYIGESAREGCLPLSWKTPKQSPCTPYSSRKTSLSHL